MESASAAAKNNIHDHHQHQIVCSSPLYNDFMPPLAGTPPPSCLAWTPNSSILSNVSFASSISSDSSGIMNLRNPRLQNQHENNNNNLVSSLMNINPCIMSNTNKDYCLDQWNNGGIHQHQHQHHQSNGHDQELEYSPHDDEIKQESSSNLYNPSGGGACYSNYAKELREVDELNVKLLFKSLSYGGGGGGGGESSINGGGNSNLEECSNSFNSSPNEGSRNLKQQSSSSSCSQIYPTINVSELLGHQQNVSMLGDSSCGFGLNLQALDLFNNSAAATRFGATFRPPPSFEEHGGFFKNNSGGGCFPNYGLDFMHQSAVDCTLDSGGNVEVHNKRIDKHEEANAKAKAGNKTQIGTKRSRLDSRACPPFKVRKEKLGDRIAALQQLVSPYGKTDTASVLMEAIGYIKFLQNQVETLSVPYLKSSRHKNNRTAVTHGGYGDSEERKQDLKSIGLCLVPVSCLSYVTDSNGAMWPL